MSLDSAYEGGEFTTDSPRVHGGTGSSSTSIPAPWAPPEIEIRDDSERPVPGFTMVRLRYHQWQLASNREVTWKNQSDVGGLAGKTVRLRFE